MLYTVRAQVHTTFRWMLMLMLMLMLLPPVLLFHAIRPMRGDEEASRAHI
jgi:hypothetical protein